MTFHTYWGVKVRITGMQPVFRHPFRHLTLLLNTFGSRLNGGEAASVVICWQWVRVVTRSLYPSLKRKKTFSWYKKTRIEPKKTYPNDNYIVCAHNWSNSQVDRCLVGY
jgi:hypothetical protein